MISNRRFISTMMDHLLLILVVAPLVSLWWFCIWWLTDYYIFPEERTKSLWFTCIAGYLTVFVCHLAHERLTKLAQLTDTVYNPLARFYSILLIVAIVFQWRGFWYIMDDYLGPGWTSGGACIALGVVLMAVSGCSKSMVGVIPLILIADDKTNYFVAVSKFHDKSVRNKGRQLADHLYSVFYIQLCVIMIWRGIWHLQDYAIYPGEEFLLKSGVISTAIGFIGTAWFYLLQWPINSGVKHLPKMARFVAEQTWRVLAVAWAIFYWRGSWVLFDLAIGKDVFITWFVTVASGFALCALNTWSIATLRGVWIDDPLDSNADSILLDIHYFTCIVDVLKERRLSKALAKASLTSEDKLLYPNLSKGLLGMTREKSIQSELNHKLDDISNLDNSDDSNEKESNFIKRDEILLPNESSNKVHFQDQWKKLPETMI